MPNLTFLLKVSRPRFWLYVFGPYLIGLAAGASTRNDFLTLDVLYFGFYFLFPANLLIYGINDIFDFETDRRNPKKAEYEMLVRPESHRALAWAIAVLNIPFIFLAYFFAPQVLPSIGGFLFFSIFYSAPPIRAKAAPLVDSAFNVLYVFPGTFAYQMLTGSFPPLILFLAAGLWTMAMHAYSAIPDIDADREARLSTIATLLGKNATLLFCFIAYVGAASLAFPFLGYLALPLALIYMSMIAVTASATNENSIFKIYKFFPILNAAVGFLLFWYVALKLI